MRAAENPTSFVTLPQGSPPALVAAIEDATRHTFDRHGPAAFMMPREAAVVHETGHAIVAAHEGLTVRSVSVYSRSVPNVGVVWGGWCNGGGPWTSGPDSSAADDLRRARIIVAGLAGEAVTRRDLPGSSLDELALSQMIGLNAASKLYPGGLSDEDYDAYAQQLWNEQVWKVALEILFANQEPFNRLAQFLAEKEKVKGPRLRNVLQQIRRIAS